MTVLVSPPTYELQTTESLPLGLDATALLSSGQTFSTATSALTDIATGVAIILTNPPSVSGNVVTQVVVGSQLAGGHAYRLVVTFTVGTSETWSMPLRITVPF